MTRLDLREEARRHIPAIPPISEGRHLARNTWRARMINEHSSARVFEALADQLEAAGVPPKEVERCRTFAEEERHHGILCGAVVEALGGEATADVPELPPVPPHAEVTYLEAAIRNLLSISCLSETVAVALIGAERLEMPDGELRELLTRIYADECGHANFGWRLLGQLLERGDADLPRRLGAYLEVAFAHLELHELGHLPDTVELPPGSEALGLCDGTAAKALFYDTVRTILLPSLEALGIPATEAWKARARHRAHVSDVLTAPAVRRAAS